MFFNSYNNSYNHMNKYMKEQFSTKRNTSQKPNSLETVKRNLKRLQKNNNLYNQIQELELPLIYSHLPKDLDREKQGTRKKSNNQFFSFKFSSRSNLFDNIKRSVCKKRMSSLDVFNTFIPTQRYNPQNIDQLSQAQKQLLCTNKFKNFKTIHHQSYSPSYRYKRKSSETSQIYQKTFRARDDSYNTISQKIHLEQKKYKKKNQNYQNIANFTNDVSSIMTRIKKKRLNLKKKPLNLEWIEKSKKASRKKLQEQYSPWGIQDEHENQQDQKKQAYQQMSVI